MINLKTAAGLLLFFCLVSNVSAFGAGDIGELSNQAGRAFRHGDIEAAIEGLAKSIGGHVSGSAIVQGITTAFFSGNVQGLAESVKGGAAFTANDVKRIYFGNFLRDYSQACDIAGFSKLTADSIVFLVSILSFLAFGYGTQEFQVTKERLSVYLLTEHIDNPKGYGGNEDPQKYDARLRPRVEEREMEIDPKNGMKAYIASQGRGFDTSADCVRRNLEKCIEFGRRGHQGSKKDRYEAYRYLGTALHTLEDLSAHSNFVELCLLKMGHRNVFCYVGDRVRVRSPQGQDVPPLITGSFGSTDFISSLLGEGADKLSSSTLGRLNTKMDEAKNNDTKSLLSTVQQILSKIPSSGDAAGKANELKNVQQKAMSIDPDNVVPEEAQQAFYQALCIRDDIMRMIESLMEQFPVVQEFLDELANTLTLLVMSVVEPYFSPIISKLVDGLNTGNEVLLNDEDQMEIFSDPNSSDPTHSIISKDHFSNQLNFVAGKVAITVVKHSVTDIVRAWSDPEVNARQTIDTVIQALHHPFFASGRSPVQNAMYETVEEWVNSLGRNRDHILQSLTKEQVQAGNNKVDGSPNMGTLGHGCSHGHQAMHKPAGGRQGIAHGRVNQHGQSQTQHQNQNQSQTSSFGTTYGESQGRHQASYGESHNTPARHAQTYGNQSYGNQSYGNQSYGGHSEPSYGQMSSQSSNVSRPSHNQSYDSSGRSDDAYGRRSENAYGDNGYSAHQQSHYNQERRDDTYATNSYESSTPSYGQHRQQEHHNRRRDDSNERRADNYGRQNNEYQSSTSYQSNAYASDAYKSNNYGRQNDYSRRDDDRSDFGVGRMSLGNESRQDHRQSQRQNEDYSSRYGNTQDRYNRQGGRHHNDDSDDDDRRGGNSSGYGGQTEQYQSGRHHQGRGSHEYGGYGDRSEKQYENRHRGDY